MIFNKYREEFKNLKKYSSGGRSAFYDLAMKHCVRITKDALIADLGAGNLDFFNLALSKGFKKENIFLLDSNFKTVNDLKKEHNNTFHYIAPSRLPFDDGTLDFIHASHLVEHLSIQELYKFIREMDRVLKKDGILMISTPMLWPRFYDDLSHVRPYNPHVFIKYLCGGQGSLSKESISSSYEVIDLVFRYKKNYEEYLGSDYYSVFIFIKLFYALRRKIGITSYLKNGYSLVLKK